MIYVLNILLVMDLNQYIKSKCFETASIELIKQTIHEDSSLSPRTKQELISEINMFSNVKNLAELCKILSGRM